MKNGAFIVFKKELARFFGDKRLLFTSVIMPGLLIYLIYTIVGNSMSTMLSDKTSSFKAAAVNMPPSVVEQLEQLNFEIEDIDLSQVDEVKDKIKSNDYAVCAVFPDGFDEALKSYKAGSSADSVPNVAVYYNSADITSSNAYAQTVAVLDSMEKEISNVFDINYRSSPDDDPYDLATDEDTTGTLLGMILPMLLMMLLFSSCVSLAPESIAGEKERGTIAALLITPVPRSQIILGKVLALSVMSLLGGLSSFLGTFLSIPALMQNLGEESELITTDVYKFADYLWLILLILTTVLLLITIISVISTLASSVKEASSMVMPVMIVLMVVCFMTMYQTETKTELYWYFVPLFNTVEGMTQVFSFSAVPLDLIVTCAANIVYSALGMLALTKLFDNEKIMFG